MEPDSYEKIKEKRDNYIATEANLKKELEKILSEEQKLINQLATIEAQTESQNEEINFAKRHEGSIKEEELHKKCKEAIDFFLKDIYRNKEDLNLPIKIEYQQMKILKSLTDENITFKQLKDETKLQFGKDANEFFFADENDNIFLDELHVIPALFPLSNVKVDKYEPVIKVIDKPLTKKKKEKFIIEEDDFTQGKEAKNSLKERLGSYFKKNAIQFYFFIIFCIFIGFWTQSCIVFLHAREYRMMNKYLKSKTFSADYDWNNLFEGFGDEITFSDGVSLITISGEAITNCQSERVSYSSEEVCYSTYSLTTRNKVKHPSTFLHKKINGLFGAYDKNMGTNETISKSTVTSKIQSISSSASTVAFILIVNCYSKNLGAFFTIKYLFEKGKEGNFISKNYSLSMAVADIKVDGFLITSIVISIVLLILLFFILKKEKTEVDLFNQDDKKEKESFFRKPTASEIIWIVNIFFYYGLIIFRFSYFGSKVESFTGEFTDLDSKTYRFGLVTDLNCFNILLFYVTVMLLLNIYLIEYRIILQTLKIFIFDMLPLTLCLIIPFCLVAMYITYFMAGDYYEGIYRNLSFIFIKVVQSFFRGSIDHFEYQNTGAYDNDYSKNENTQLRYKIGNAGYIIYSLIYYFFTFVFVKGCVVGICYLAYRNEYIRTVDNEEKRKKEELIAQKLKKRNEEQKAKEDSLLKHKETKNEEKDIEMTKLN